MYWIDAVSGIVKHCIVDPSIRSSIRVDVKGHYYGTTTNAYQVNTVFVEIPAEDVKVCIADSIKQTNSSGIAVFNEVNYSSQKAKIENSHFRITVNPSDSTYETSIFTPVGTDSVPGSVALQINDQLQNTNRFIP